MLTVVQHEPTSRLSVIMPPDKKKILRYQGRATSGQQIKEFIDVPPMLYTFDNIGSPDMKMYVVDELSEGKISCRPMRMANVMGDGRVCWGENQRGAGGPRELVYTYWGSFFNDDLTPYPRPQTMDYWAYAIASPEFRTENKAQMDLYDLLIARRIRSNMPAAGTVEWIGNFGGDAVYNAVKSFIATHNKSERTRRYVGARLKYLAQYTERQSAQRDDSDAGVISRRNAILENNANATPEDYSTVGRIQRRQTNMAAAYRRYQEYFSKLQVISAINDTSMRVSSAWTNLIGWSTLLILHKRRGFLRLNEDINYIRTMYEDYLSQYKVRLRVVQTMFPKEVIPEFARMMARFGRHWARTRYEAYVRDDLETRAQAFHERANPSEVTKWWSGGWTKYGELQNMVRIVMGDNRQMDDVPYHAVLNVQHEAVYGFADGGSAIADKFREYFRKRSGRASVLVPVWRHPNDDNAVIGEFEGVPFIGVYSSSNQYVADISDFSETAIRIQSAAKEIFG